MDELAFRQTPSEAQVKPLCPNASHGTSGEWMQSVQILDSYRADLQARFAVQRICRLDLKNWRKYTVLCTQIKVLQISTWCFTQ